MSERIVVIAIGNAWRSDDGAGLAVGQRVAALAPAGVEVFELDGEPARVVEAWDGATLAVVVDAVRTGAPAGTLHRIDPATHPVPATVDHSSHALGPGDAYELGRALGRLPERLVLIGIEVADVQTGLGFSPDVSAAIDDAVEYVLALVARPRAPH